MNAAPLYSLARRRTGPGSNRTGKLHIEHVRDIRRWARREGFGVSRAEQARRVQQWYPGISTHALEQVLSNESWRDPAYTPGLPDPEWHLTPVALLVLLMVRQMYAPVGSSLKVEVFKDAGLAQGAEAVLDGAAVEADGLRQGLRGADLDAA